MFLGEYTFPDDDWKNVTQTAKDLIKSMLTVDVNKRIDIDVFMRSPWIALPNEVPTTPLGSLHNLYCIIHYMYFSNIAESDG